MATSGRYTICVIAAIAFACLASNVSALAVPPSLDLTNADMPKTSEIMNEIFGILGASFEHHQEVTEKEVKRHLLGKKTGNTVGNLLGLAAGSARGLAAIDYQDVYQQFTDAYCTDPEATRPDPPSFSLADPLYATTTFTGPTLGVQLTMGSCADLGNKTFECLRPQLVIVKSPATITKEGPSATFSKPGGEIVDKSCDWTDSKDIGHGESVELYNGGSGTYDYSGYREGLYGAVGGAMAGFGGRFNRIASLYNGISKNRKGRVAPLGQLFKQRGLKEFDLKNADRKTRKRIGEVLPGFFD